MESKLIVAGHTHAYTRTCAHASAHSLARTHTHTVTRSHTCIFTPTFSALMAELIFGHKDTLERKLRYCL